MPPVRVCAGGDPSRKVKGRPYRDLPPAPILPTRRPLVTQDDFEDHDPATIRRLIQSSLERRR